MTGGNGDENVGAYSSPPCLLHEVDADYAGLGGPRDFDPLTELDCWRKAERARLVERRLNISSTIREQYDKQILENLDEAISSVGGNAVSAYWPFRGEPNLHPIFERLKTRRIRCALPVVIARDEPLIFRQWMPGDPLARGVWNIPTPKADALEVVPDIIIAPVVGFDSACYRLGYGGCPFRKLYPRILMV